MRELKFRGWNENKKGWVEFFDLHITASSPLNILDLTGLPGIILEQFTGIEDKNSLGIYEGDIVELEILDEDSAAGRTFTERYIVEWSKKDFAFQFSDARYHVLGTHQGKWSMNLPYINIEVIGNVHRNPELLT